MSGACPSCGASGLEVFNEVDRVPVHSCRLVATRAEALAFPTGGLRLALCAACGFVTNAAYDPGLQDYSVAYEETQGFSPHFNRFLRELAERWVERYGLRGKRVLEIGSGKGEFLLLLHELGIGEGIGIDPAYVPERVEERPGLRFVRDLYSERYADLRADAVVSRHTLEHIHPVGEFMRLVRSTLSGGEPVLFELPDVLRVLREGAFWDVYYEHASYFSPGSLARLFRAAGLEVLELELGYDDQYIVIEAQPGNGRELLPLEEEPAAVAEAAADFRRAHETQLERWRERLSGVRDAVIWGAGSKGVAFLTTLGTGAGIELAVDVNPHKQDMFLAGSGVEVVAPERLRERRPELVVAMNPVYLDEIGSTLSELGLDAQLESV
jgi:SAM-dependent methyltransferase